MKRFFSFRGTVRKFPGPGGWMYVAVPKKYTRELKERRRAWGQYPSTAKIGATTWKTKLMMRKGGDFFVALKAAVRKEEEIIVGDTVRVSFRLQ